MNLDQIRHEIDRLRAAAQHCSEECGSAQWCRYAAEMFETLYERRDTNPTLLGVFDLELQTLLAAVQRACNLRLEYEHHFDHQGGLS